MRAFPVRPGRQGVTSVRILLTGGSGLLGTELLKLDAEIEAPGRKELDITDGDSVARCIGRLRPDIVIHAAAITDNREIEAIRPKRSTLTSMALQMSPAPVSGPAYV